MVEADAPYTLEVEDAKCPKCGKFLYGWLASFWWDDVPHRESFEVEGDFECACGYQVEALKLQATILPANPDGGCSSTG